MRDRCHIKFWANDITCQIIQSNVPAFVWLILARDYHRPKTCDNGHAIRNTLLSSTSSCDLGSMENGAEKHARFPHRSQDHLVILIDAVMFSDRPRDAYYTYNY